MEDLNPLYEEQDFNRSISPYTLYRKSLEAVLDFNQIESFGDFGCINGRLLESIKNKYPRIAIKGYDVFEWAKQYAGPLVRDQIEIADLRQPLNAIQKFDVVNCTEVGEHLPRENEQVFLDNLSQATQSWLILSWSNEPNAQHLNPRPASYIKKQMKQRGFEVLPSQTKLLRKALKRNVNDIGYQWWSQNVVVYQRTPAEMHKKYFLLGTQNRHLGTLKIYSHKFLTWSSFQEKFVKLTNEIKRAVGEKKFFSIFRFGDGDFFFLMRWAKGSAKPGRRGSTVPYSEIDSPWFRYWMLKNDRIVLELEPACRKKYLFYGVLQQIVFNRYFIKQFLKGNPNRWQLLKNYLMITWQALFGPRLAFEVIYALVASRWVFREFNNQIGIIGNERKIKLIERLMLNQQYRDYLGMEKFTDYIGVPQKGAADYPLKLAEEIGKQIKNSPAKIFLVGMGHAKTGVLSYLKSYSDAVFIDVGVGIDALAGCVNQERPYFAGWTNFRFKNFDYSAIDQMDYNDPAWEKSKYKTVWLA